MKIKDPISGFSHLAGIVLSVLGTILLLINSHSLTEVVAFSIFGLTSFLLYTASTIYHLFGKPPEQIDLLRKLDHSSIYFLIAGSFAPFCLILVKGLLGYSVFIIVWILAISGTSTKFVKIFWKMPRWAYVGLYILMGLLGFALIYPLSFYPGIILWLIIGGAFYVTGAVIYAIKKPNLFKGFGFHELFHIFVLLGTASHFFCVYKYIALN